MYVYRATIKGPGGASREIPVEAIDFADAWDLAWNEADVPGGEHVAAIARDALHPDDQRTLEGLGVEE